MTKRGGRGQENDCRILWDLELAGSAMKSQHSGEWRPLLSWPISRSATVRESRLSGGPFFGLAGIAQLQLGRPKGFTWVSECARGGLRGGGQWCGQTAGGRGR